MVASFRGSDWMVPKGTAARLEDALEQRKIEHDVKEYPGVGHAFLDDYKGPMGVLCVFLRASYKDKEAGDARNRIRAFFARHPHVVLRVDVRSGGSRGRVAHESKPFEERSDPMGTIKHILLSIIFLPICACVTTMKNPGSDHL
jgi:hypothetical protein